MEILLASVNNSEVHGCSTSSYSKAKKNSKLAVLDLRFVAQGVLPKHIFP